MVIKICCVGVAICMVTTTYKPLIERIFLQGNTEFLCATMSLADIKYPLYVG